MEKTYIVVICLAIFAVLVLGMCILLYYLCSRAGKKYKAFKDPVETWGEVTDIDIENRYDTSDVQKPFIITYSYSDDFGNSHLKSFKATRHPFRVGDKIAVHYDMYDPGNSMTDFELKCGRSLWWKVLLALAIMIIPAVIAVKLGMV